MTPVRFVHCDEHDYHSYRVVPLDGRSHLGPNITLWMRGSRGHWEKNTLVVDTNLNVTTG